MSARLEGDKGEQRNMTGRANEKAQMERKRGERRSSLHPKQFETAGF
jgi:hypothetical protein